MEPLWTEEHSLTYTHPPIRRRAPMPVRGISSPSYIEVKLLESGRDGTQGPVANRPSIHLDHGSHMGRRTRHEALIGDVQLASVDGSLYHVQAHFFLR